MVEDAGPVYTASRSIRESGTHEGPENHTCGLGPLSLYRSADKGPP